MLADFADRDVGLLIMTADIFLGLVNQLFVARLPLRSDGIHQPAAHIDNPLLSFAHIVEFMDLRQRRQP
ncbi:hypothetical protein D3C73_1466260 [compost metagenome]